MTEIDLFTRLAVALAIGLMVGIERGWQTRGAEDNGRAAGLRTYGLSGLMGGVCGLLQATLGGPVVGIGLLAFAAAFGAFSWLEAQARHTASATSLIAGLLTYLLGALATVGDVQAAIAAAVCMTVLLALRPQLHRWLEALTWLEIRAGLILMVMSFLLLPLLPDRAIDPWGAVNLHEVWLLAILMALISFTGYVAVRLFGDRLGIIVTAAAGGLASSTATTLTFARLARDHGGAVNLLVGGILISGAVMALRVGVIAVALNPALLGALGPPLIVAAVAMAAMALGFILLPAAEQREGQGAGAAPVPRLAIANPLVVGTSLRLALFIVAVMLAAALVRRVWGDPGVLLVAGLSGIADVDAITLTMARMDAGAPLAAQAILLAAAVNSAAKAAMAGWVGGRTVGVRVGLASGLAVTLAAGVVWFGG